MTTFPTSDGPSGYLRREGERSLPRLGIDRSLGAPGLSVAVGTGGAAKLEQIAGLLEAFVGTTGTSLELDARKAAEEAENREKILAEQARVAELEEKNADAVAKMKRGIGERDARAKLSIYQSAIDSDQITVPDGADPVEFARTFLEEQFSGVDPDYQAGAVEQIEAEFVKALTNRKEAIARTATKDSLNSLGQWGVGKTPAQIEETIAQAMQFPGASNLTEAEIRSSIVQPSIEVAVAAGEPEKVEALAPAMQDDGYIARSIEQATTNKNQARTARHQAGFDAYTLRSTDETVPTQALRKDLDALLSKDAIDPQVYRTETRALDDRDKALLKKNQELQLLQATQAAERSITQADTALAANARLTGGLATIVGPARVEIDDPTSPTGKRWIEKSEEDRKRDVFEQEFPKLQTFGEQVEFSGTNNYPVPQWVSQMQAGPAGLFGAFASSPDGNYQIPANTVEGYKLWKQLDAVSPGVRNLNASAGVNTFYSRVAIAEKYVTRGDPEAALRHVAKIDTSKAGRDTDNLDTEKYRTKLAGTIGDASNYGEAEQVVQSIAKLYRDTGVPEKDAVEEALRDFKKTHTKVRGQWLYTGDGNLTLSESEINRVLKHVAGRYAAARGKEEDLEASDLTFASTGTNGVWTLYNKRANHAVISADADVPDRVGTEKFGIFSYQDLRLILDRLYEGDRQRKLEGVLNTDAKVRDEKPLTLPPIMSLLGF